MAEWGSITKWEIDGEMKTWFVGLQFQSELGSEMKALLITWCYKRECHNWKVTWQWNEDFMVTWKLAVKIRTWWNEDLMILWAH